MPRTKPRAAAVATSSRAMEADHQTEELSIRRGCDGINDALNRLNDRHHTGRKSAGKQTDRKATNYGHIVSTIIYSRDTY